LSSGAWSRFPFARATRPYAEATTPKRGIPIAVGAIGGTAIRAHSPPIGAAHVALERIAGLRFRVIASNKTDALIREHEAQQREARRSLRAAATTAALRAGNTSRRSRFELA
jgi:hypothetical protein